MKKPLTAIHNKTSYARLYCYLLPTAFIRRSFSIGVLLLLPTVNSLKAQDDSNCGFIIDGILADSIPNWNFSEMSIVYPLKQEWSKYDIVRADIYFTGARSGSGYCNCGMSFFQLKPEDFNQYSGAQLAVWQVFAKGDVTSNYSKQFYTGTYCSNCPDDWNAGAPKRSEKPMLVFRIRGHKITSYKEMLSNNNSIIKKPLYDNGKEEHNLQDYGELLYEISIPFNRCYCIYDKATYKKLTKQEGKGDIALGQLTLACDECKVDNSKPFSIPGKKFNLPIEKIDFKGQFGKIKEHAPVEIKKEEPVKTAQPAKKKTK